MLRVFLAGTFVCLVTLSASSRPCQAAVIDFEDVAVATGANVIGGDVASGGFNFDTAPSHSHLVNDAFASFNGTTWLGIDDTAGVHLLTMSSIGGGAFSLESAEFSEFFTGDGGQALTVVVTGFFSGGGSITTDVILDQITDAGGVLNDFQTHIFSAAWANLGSVTFQGIDGGNNWWAIDNIMVNSATVAAVPEPSTLTLLGMGAFGLVAGTIRRRRQQKAA